jgi:capsular polysaccharide biosynthesis protein
LLLLEKLGISVNSFNYILINEVNSDRLEHLKLTFGIETEKLVTVSANEKVCYRMDSAIIPSSYQHLNHSSPEMVAKLRQRLFNNPEPTAVQQKRRIFVSRERAKGRRIVNQGDVDTLLDKFSIETVFLESLSLSEQMKIFSNSELILAPHGAGLANLLWCERNTRVVELINDRWHNPEYYFLSVNNYLDYRAIYWFATDCANPCLADFTVPLNSLERTLAEIGLTV